MNPQEIDSILKQTLEDYRVSRSEKKALKSFATDLQAKNRVPFALHRAFELARRESVDPDAHALMTWLEDIVKVVTADNSGAQSKLESEALFSPQDSCAARIATLIGMVRSKLDICVFTITDDRISSAIADAHDRDVNVRIISDNDKSNDRGSDVDRLRRRGIPLRIDQSEFHMHHKYALFDEQRLLTGSYNWTVSAAKHNEENIVITNDSRLLDRFQQHFDDLWNQLD